MYYLYIIYSESLDSYYTGYTANIEERIRRHNSNNRKGFTARAADWKLVYSECYTEKKAAADREKVIKGWKSRSLIQELVNTDGSEHSD